MPNWCHSVLTVNGDAESISLFMQGLKKEDGKETYEILKSYYPCPEDLIDTMAGSMPESDERYQEWMEKKASNRERYGYEDWYEWCWDKWGTKWGDCNTYLLSQTQNQLVFQLESAWSPIEAGLAEVSRIFPTLTFELEMLEESGEYAGLHVMKEGNTIFYEEFAPGEMISEMSEDGEEFDYDVYDEFIEENMDKVRKNYDEWRTKEVNA